MFIPHREQKFAIIPIISISIDIVSEMVRESNHSVYILIIIRKTPSTTCSCWATSEETSTWFFHSLTLWKIFQTYPTTFQTLIDIQINGFLQKFMFHIYFETLSTIHIFLNKKDTSKKKYSHAIIYVDWSCEIIIKQPWQYEYLKW